MRRKATPVLHLYYKLMGSASRQLQMALERSEFTSRVLQNLNNKLYCCYQQSACPLVYYKTTVSNVEGI